MTRKIALEEHFLAEGFAATFRRRAAERLPEIDALRLDAMEKAGIDVAVLSLIQPGIQGERDTSTAIRKAKVVNDTWPSGLQSIRRAFAVSPQCRRRLRRKLPTSSSAQ